MRWSGASSGNSRKANQNAEYARATEKAEKTIALAHEIGDKHYANMAGLVLAESLLDQGRLEDCEDTLQTIEQNDPSSDFFVLGNIQRIRGLAASGLGVLFSSHDPDHAFLYADRAALLHQGSLLRLAPPREAITPTTLRALYGIEVAVVDIPSPAVTVSVPLGDAKAAPPWFPCPRPQ